jgi:transcription antitermination protein NusB
MPARHRSRQRALQVLFAWDHGSKSIDDAIAAFYETLGSEENEPERTPPDPFMEILVRGAAAKAAELDKRILANSENWRLERMAAVDRNILRLAVFEMTETETPAAVVIDEALELARQFSTDESVSFVNGLLDAIRRQLAAQT